MTGFSDQFDKYSWLTIDDLGKDYDYESIMHYDRKAFTKNGKATIVNTYNEVMEFGTSDKKLSQKDIIEINALYDCISSKSYMYHLFVSFTDFYSVQIRTFDMFDQGAFVCLIIHMLL